MNAFFFPSAFLMEAVKSYETNLKTELVSKQTQNGTIQPRTLAQTKDCPFGSRALISRGVTRESFIDRA